MKVLLQTALVGSVVAILAFMSTPAHAVTTSSAKISSTQVKPFFYRHRYYHHHHWYHHRRMHNGIWIYF